LAQHKKIKKALTRSVNAFSLYRESMLSDPPLKNLTGPNDSFDDLSCPTKPSTYFLMDPMQNLLQKLLCVCLTNRAITFY